MTKISVLMPAYNAEKYIREAIDSILKQSYMDFEFIIYNDGSMDKTANIVHSYEDNRIVLINNNDNKGVSFVRAELLKIAKGQYITWMDADDTCDTNRLEKQVQHLDNNMDYVAVGTGYSLNYKGTLTNRYLFSSDKNIRLYPAFCGASVMFRKTVLKNVSSTSKEGGGEDYAFLLQIIKYGKVHNLKNVKYYYRQDNPNSVSKNPQASQNILQAFVKYRMNADVNAVEALNTLPVSKGLCIAVWFVMAKGFKGLPYKYIIPTISFGLWWKLMHRVSK